MLRTFILIILVGGVSTDLVAQSTIVYAKGPSFGMPFRFGSRPLDLNQDGQMDYTFFGSDGICTHDVPSSACYIPFYIGGAATNEVLISGHALAQPFGAIIESNSIPGAIWVNLSGPAPLTTYYWSERHQEGYSLGSLGIQGVGYLGVRFHANDGVHFGWIRVRLPAVMDGSTFEFSPVVVEWAYETRPNTPIRAGATDLEDSTTEFTVSFRNTDGTPQEVGEYPSYGQVQLQGTTLRYELHVTGTHFANDLRGPAVAHSQAKALMDFARPRINIHIGCRLFYDPQTGETVQKCGPAYSVFFGEEILTPSQIIHLRRGALYFRACPRNGLTNNGWG